MMSSYDALILKTGQVPEMTQEDYVETKGLLHVFHFSYVVVVNTLI